MVHFLLHAPSSCILYNNCFLIESGLGNDAGNRAGGHQCTLLDLLEFYSDQSSTGCGRGIISVPFWKLWRGRRPMGLCMCQCGYSTTRGGSRIPRCGLRPRPVHLRGRWRSARTSAGPAHGLLYARRSMLGRLPSTGSSSSLARAWQSRMLRWASLIRISPRAQAQADDSAKEGRISPGCFTSSCWTMSGTKESAQRIVVLWSTSPSIWDSLSRQGEVFEKRTWLPRSSLATTSSNRLSIRKC